MRWPPAAARFGGEVEQVRILTPDKDLGQCLEGDHVVVVDVIRKRVMNEQALLERRGIRPESVPDYLALTGDEADGIPGLPGFGERTAGALLGRFVHLETVPLDPQAVATDDPRRRPSGRDAARAAGRRAALPDAGHPAAGRAAGAVAGGPALQGYAGGAAQGAVRADVNRLTYPFACKYFQHGRDDRLSLPPSCPTLRP